MPSRRVLIVLVLIALAFRAILLAADPDNDELSGLSVATGESARLIVERGEWFRIDRAAHDAWLTHMREALDEIKLAPEAERVLWDYLTVAADMLINTEDA